MPLGANKAAIMGVAGTAATASVVLLYDTDHSNASTASITSGITSTYGEYIFRFYNINPATNNTSFHFQGSIDGGSNYNVAITSTFFDAYHSEAGGSPALSYEPAWDLAQGTGFQAISQGASSDADHSTAGELHIFNPASTTYVKHFYVRAHGVYEADYSQDFLPAGYFNTTSAINAVQFKMSSGNFDGTIKMWGVK